MYDDSFPPLPLKNGIAEHSGSPPVLPPKTTRPLGGLNVFTPSKERYSIISSDSRDSFLNDKFDLTELAENLPPIPPEVPEKQSPVKNGGQRDSGYNEVSSETILIGTPEQIIDKGTFLYVLRNPAVGQKLKFWSKIEILVKNRNFAQKSIFWSKIEILVKNRNFGQNRNFAQK